MKKRIVLASILKPINDTRMCEKWAVSLARSGRFAVTVIGQNGEPPNEAEIDTVGIGTFSRLSLNRWLASFKVLKVTLKVKPQLLIVNTHELLIVALLNRILFGSRIIYDIQENYYRNILYGNAFPPLLRWPLAAWVRLKERTSRLWVHHLVLAEAGYQGEMDFLGSQPTVIENKCVRPSDFYRKPDPTSVQLLFSGTIAKSTGVFEAIELARLLKERDSRISLTIIGFCAQARVLDQLQKTVAQYPWITVIGGDRLVPHHQIMDAIASAHFGIISYPPSPHVEGSIPTKLYEYLSCRLPILLQRHPQWSALCARSGAAVELDFQSPDPDRIHAEMHRKMFYTGTPTHVTWAEEESKLLALVNSLLKVSI